MSTRGTFGLRHNGVTKMTYNHWDSYPEGLGQEFVNRIKSKTDDELITAYNNMNMVEQDGEYGFPKFSENIMNGTMNLEKRTDDDLDDHYIEYTYIYDIKSKTLIAHGADQLGIEKLQEQLKQSDELKIYPPKLQFRATAQQLLEQGDYKYITWSKIVANTNTYLTQEEYENEKQRIQDIGLPVQKMGNIEMYNIPFRYIKTPEELISWIDDIAWDRESIAETFDIPVDETIEWTKNEMMVLTGDNDWVDDLDESMMADNIIQPYQDELYDYLDKLKETLQITK